MATDDRRGVERLFDQIGDGEWDRFAEDAAAAASFEIHRRFLHPFVRRDTRALDVGAGPGRFALELVSLGARVLVTDISAGQLNLARQHLREADLDGSILGYERLDACDLTPLNDDDFDLVLAYGGVLSYAFEDAARALSELFRVLRPGGHVVGSVMSLAGNARRYLASFPAAIDAVGVPDFTTFLATGDQRRLRAVGAHPCRMFTSEQLSRLINDAGGAMIAASASNWLALADPETVAGFLRSPARRGPFLDWEERMCREPGAVDGGTHLLFAARRV
jgi:ubiquinone/menaquinone biosynthesis C-methylase UbiE